MNRYVCMLRRNNGQIWMYNSTLNTRDERLYSTGMTLCSYQWQRCEYGQVWMYAPNKG